MTHLSSFLVAILLILASVGLIAWHVRSWRRARQGELEERERDFHLRQLRRRVQTSVMIGLLGVAIFAGQLLLEAKTPWKLQVIYWIGVLALVLWIALLAVADMTATSFYYSREKSDFVVERAKLQAELRKARNEDAERKSRGHNGKPRL
jgi:hypothetical protein